MECSLLYFINHI